jgi:nitric oxide reductase NorQ protein|tara:strand:+ start:266 stop:1495 length:1230 start_codon:yes stop_codon:yes gene_type:complete
MTLTTIEAMEQAVTAGGGRMTEEAYLTLVKDLICESGRETTIESLKVNAFNKKRMDKAGISRVTIGDSRQVWSNELADGLKVGNVPFNVMNGVTEATQAPSITQPRKPVAIVDGGVFYGIPRKTLDERSDYAEHIQALIPSVTGFVESDRQEYRLMANRYSKSLAGDTIKSHMLCVGPKGCGKSLLAKDFFANLGVPLMRINLSDGVTEDQFIGTRTLIDGQVVFQDGILTVAAKLGIPVLCDEINGARENILMALNGLMDTGVLVIPEDNNRVVKAAKGFMIIGTMNPPEDYAGVNAMNQATKDRFTYNIPFTYLDAASEAKVIMEQTGFRDGDLVKNIVALANDLRRLKNEHAMETDTSTRTLVQLVDELNDLSISESIRYVMLGRYTADERPQVEAAARARIAEFE